MLQKPVSPALLQMPVEPRLNSFIFLGDNMNDMGIQAMIDLGPPAHSNCVGIFGECYLLRLG